MENGWTREEKVLNMRENKSEKLVEIGDSSMRNNQISLVGRRKILI